MFNDHLPELPPIPESIERLIDEKVDVDSVYNLPDSVVYCGKCVVSNQRPRISFRDGVCNACHYWAAKDDTIDWDDREKQLRELCDRYRRSDGSFDVLVPSSGGKDSVYVAHMLRDKYHMNPLTMTWAPHLYTEIGFRNMQSKIHSGFNNVLLSPDGFVHRQMTRLATILLGDPFQPFIYGQTYAPLKMAAAFNIDLIFDGENGEAEYGGDVSSESAVGFTIDQAEQYWLSDFPIDKWREFGFNQRDLHIYQPPSEVELLAHPKMERHFASYYWKWEPQKHYYYCAEKTGFQPNPRGRSEGTYSKYASLDDIIDPYHFHFALLKFGIARCTSDAAHEIREHLIERDEAVGLVKKYDAEGPSDETKEAFLSYAGITEQQLERIEDRWRNDRLWRKSSSGWFLNHVVD
jgi:N-acetyl sugar amidotransferase